VSTPVVSRNLVVQCWGTPSATVGSVNEPREQEEQGHRFNEKWTYRLSPTTPDQPKERLIYWLRYDFVAAYLVTANGALVREDLAAVISGLRDRRYHPPSRSTTR
jgi:hypothetical protein